MTAAKLIGVFANHNTSHAFISLQDIAFNVPESFNFDGTTIGNQRGEVNKLDNQRALDGSTLVSKNIAGFLAASVDAVKDPVLNFLNLNTFTANPAMVLARLGFDVDSISLLLTQPIIEKITNEYFKRNNERYTSPEEIIEEELSKFSDQPKMKDLQTNQFLKEDLARIIADNSSGRRMGNKDKAYQAQVLLLFKNLITMGQNLGELTFLTKFNSVTNAVGPTIADTLVIKQRYDKFLDSMTNPTSAPPFSASAESVIDNSPILSAFYESTVGDNGASRLLF